MFKVIRRIIIDFCMVFFSGLLANWLITGLVHGVNLYVLFAMDTLIVLLLAVNSFYRMRITNSSLEIVKRASEIIIPVIIILSVACGIFKGFTNEITRWILLCGAISYCMIVGIRAVIRVVMETSDNLKGLPSAIVYGAGDLGTVIAHQSAKGHFDYNVVGFLDDNPKSKGEIVADRKILGTIDDLDRVLSNKTDVKVLIIAITNISSDKIQKAVSTAKKHGVSVMIVPSLFETKKSNDTSLRDLNYADLLGRPLITIEKEPLFDMIGGKTILVTGAGGSIGSEICKQIMDYGPDKLILVDIDETELHDLSLRLLNYEREWSEKVVPVVCDIKNREKLLSVFEKYKPNLVFHAAAYKHVPLMELYPEEAIINNVCGSYSVFDACYKTGVSKTVVISTDKAVNPTNIMGATKRVVELMAEVFNANAEKENRGIEFCCVRFGNVIGSRGSMLPLFLEQIKSGKPVTVTDRKIIRYFMAIPEAVSLVFRAASLAHGGEVMVLDMGEPVNIYDFATKLVDVFGDGRSYVKVTGLRPGEKLYEELLANKDNTVPTVNEKIFKAKIKSSDLTLEVVRDSIDKLAGYSPKELVSFLKRTVPEYHNPKDAAK